MHNTAKDSRQVVIMLLTISFVLCLTVQGAAQVSTERLANLERPFTAEYKLANGFLLRGEYRRDWSNQPFFLTEQTGLLKKEQNTATLGLVWWLGRKQGTW